ncbi:hypothetical protein [Colwellia sp. MEBiC06753]
MKYILLLFFGVLPLSSVTAAQDEELYKPNKALVQDIYTMCLDAQTLEQTQASEALLLDCVNTELTSLNYQMFSNINLLSTFLEEE